MTQIICPHCFVTIFNSWILLPTNQPIMANELGYSFVYMKCPACNESIVKMEWNSFNKNSRLYEPLSESSGWRYVLPINPIRFKLNGEIPEKYQKMFLESASILENSPDASAAISRKCLQELLKDYEKTNSDTLYLQIEEVVKKTNLDPSLSNLLHLLRKTGNAGVHLKLKISGQILEVDKKDAESSLKILFQLFNFYIVDVNEREKMFNELNDKYDEP